MSNCKWATLSQLLTEQRNYRTVRTKHVTETSSNELSYTFYLAVLDSLIKTLYINLTDTLRATHHVSRVNSLIGRNHNELLNAILHAQVGYYLSTPDVVLNTFARIILHHRHMLICSCMEHIIRFKMTENFLHTVFLTDRSNHGFGLDIRIIVLHHQANIVQRSLSLIYQHHFSRFVDSNLTNHFRTDRTGSTCNKHPLSTKQSTYTIHIHLNFLTRKQVFNLHLTQTNLTLWVLVLLPLFGILSDKYLYTSLYQQILKLAVFSKLFVSQRTYQKRFDTLALYYRNQIFMYRIYLLTHQAFIVMLTFIAYITLYKKMHRLLITHIVCYSDSSGTCSVHQCVHSTTADQSIIENQFNQYTRNTHC